MSESMKYEYVCVEFWRLFGENITKLDEHLKHRDIQHYDKAKDIVQNIMKSININVEIYFGIDIRNGQTLSERKDHIELILSPVVRANIELVDALHKLKPKNIPNHWSVVKYKFYQAHIIDSIVLNYGKSESDVLEITAESFKYHPIPNENNTMVSLILFIADDHIQYMFSQRKVPEADDRLIWMPKDNSLYMVINSAIGEFSALNVIDKIEIYPLSEAPNIDIKPIAKLIDDISMINNTKFDLRTCARCNYTNRQVKLLTCVCKKKYYCDTTCQLAHRTKHKSQCQSSM
jgi:hypothetical protein